MTTTPYSCRFLSSLSSVTCFSCQYLKLASKKALKKCGCHCYMCIFLFTQTYVVSREISLLGVHRIRTCIKKYCVNQQSFIMKCSYVTIWTHPTNVVNVMQWRNCVTFPETNMPRDAVLMWCVHRQPVTSAKTFHVAERKKKQKTQMNCLCWHSSTPLWIGRWANKHQEQVPFDGQGCQHEGCMSAK